MDNQEALETGEVKSSTQSSMTTEQIAMSRLNINQILAVEQLKGAAKLLKAELSTKFTKDSYGNIATKIELIVPDLENFG